jgi:hypothetical protein
MSVDKRRALRASGMSIFRSILTKVGYMGDGETISFVVKDFACCPLVHIFVKQYKI